MRDMKNTVRAAARVATLATVTSFLALLPTTSAHAAVSDCTVKDIITITTPTESDMSTDAPARVYVGDGPRTFRLTSDSLMPQDALNSAKQFFSAVRVGGESDPTVLANGTQVAKPVLTFPVATIPSSGGLPVQASGSFSWTPPGTPGPVSFSTGPNYQARTEFYNSATSTSPSKTAVANCIVRAGQDTTFHTLDVVARSTSTLALSTDTIQQGTDVSTATATVAVAAGSTAGQVVFAVDGVDRPAVTVGGGKATLALPNDLTVGTHEVTARFVPANAKLYEGSTSSARTLTVTPPATRTSTALTLTPATVPANSPVQARATVTPAGAAGSVKFAVDGTTVDTVQVSGGSATLQLPGQAEGEYAVRASFVPADPRSFTASDSAASTLTVTRPVTATTVGLSLSRTSAGAGDVVRGTASVTPLAAAGRVEFRAGDTVLGSAATANGKVQNFTLDLSALAPGQHQVVAVFTPSDTATYGSSTSSAVTLTMAAPAEETTTTVELSTRRASALDDVTATATVTPAAAGQVEFTVGTRTVTAPVASGTASAVLPKVGAGTHPVTARFLPTGGTHAPSTSAPVDLEVTAVATTTTLALGATSGVSGEKVRATATLTPASASGKVVFEVAGERVEADVTGGTAATDLPALPVGTHEVTATFTSAQSGVYATSTSAPVELRMDAPVVARETTTVVALSATRVARGDEVTATATVSSDGSAHPLGQVLFTVGGTQVPATAVEGRATVVLPELAIGDHDVTARFVPSQAQVFAPSTSAPVRLTVVRPAAATYTSVSVTPATSAPGETIRATASVTSENGAPAGQVRFTVGSETALVDVSDRVASWTLPAQAVGEGTVTAEFLPARPLELRPSTGRASFSVVAPAPVRTAMALSLASGRVAVGETTTATATVTATTGSPVGKVVFEVDGGTIEVPLTNGRATATIPDTLPVGVHPVTARFVPADPAAFAPSEATPRPVVVTDVDSGAQSTQTVVALPAGTLPLGNPGQVRVSVVAESSTAEGSVRLAVDGVRGPATDLVNGTASIALSSTLAAGTHTVVAEFQPRDASQHAPSTSSARTFVVAGPAALTTLTSLTLTPDVVEVGAPATATARVVAAAGTPAGSVEFGVAGRVLPAVLEGGSATVELPADLALGSHTVQAVYVPAGDQHAPSTASSLLTVRDSSLGARATVTTVTLSADEVLEGQLVSATVRVAAQGAVPTGDVRVHVGDTVLTAPLEEGLALLSLPSLEPGVHEVRAEMVGNADFGASRSGVAPLKVVDVPDRVVVTTTALVVDTADLRAGQSVGVSASVSPDAAGSVRFSAGWTSVTVPVANGTARAVLPAMLAGRASISATFVPADPAKVSASWDTVQVKVGKALSKVALRGRHDKRAGALKLRAKVSAVAPGGTCDTRATYVVRVGKRTVRKVVVPVSCTGVSTRDISVPKAKAYTVEVIFKGNAQIAGSRVTKVFKAQR